MIIGADKIKTRELIISHFDTYPSDKQLLLKNLIRRSLRWKTKGLFLWGLGANTLITINQSHNPEVNVNSIPKIGKGIFGMIF